MEVLTSSANKVKKRQNGKRIIFFTGWVVLVFLKSPGGRVWDGWGGGVPLHGRSTWGESV